MINQFLTEMNACHTGWTALVALGFGLGVGMFWREVFEAGKNIDEAAKEIEDD